MNHERARLDALPSQKSALIHAGLFACIALAIRLPVVFQPFWLDEIWSYFLAREASGLWFIVSDLTHSNNHVLNTVFMWLVGDQSEWVLYRLLSLASGVGAVVALAFAGFRIDRSTGYFSAALCVCSIPLILYSGEARGYAPLIFFSLLTYLNFPGSVGDESDSRGRLVLFWLFSILGALSHITFCMVFSGLCASWVWTQILGRQAPKEILLKAFRLFAVPGIVISLIAANIYLNTRPESGNQSSALAAATEMFVTSLGLTTLTQWPLAATLLVGSVLLGGGFLAGDQGRSWVITCGITPAVLFAIIQPPYIFPRYFIVLAPFFLLAAGTILGSIWNWRPIKGPAAAIIVLAVLLAGSSREYVRLVNVGKGDFLTAVRQMYALSGDEDFSVGSDHDFRNLTVLRFYTRYVQAAARMSYVDRDKLFDAPPDFFLSHSFSLEEVASPQMRLNDAAYLLIETYPHSGHSGWTWNLYRREPSRERVAPQARE